MNIILDETALHADASGCFRIYKIDSINVKSGDISFSDGAIHCGRKIAGQMKKSEYLVLLITTAGQRFDSWIKSKRADGDILAEFLCSSVGSVIAENVADKIESEISLLADKSEMGITNRYSPGYCNWNLSDQVIFFRLLPADRIGVSITNSFLMNPVKSVSALIGLGHGIKPGPYACEMCNIEDCIVRRAREK